MITLDIDIETYSKVDLEECGTYRYVHDPSFRIILLSYAFNDEPVKTFDNLKELPDMFIKALTDPNILKTAYNAPFELLCMNRYKELRTPIEQWECTQVKAAMCGYPMGLDAVAKAMGLKQQKDKQGKALIKFFSCPWQPKGQPVAVRNMPHQFPTKWQQYKGYNAQDVEVERAVRNRIYYFKIPKREHDYWILDQKINARGIRIDVQMVQKALKILGRKYNELYNEVKELTQLPNPNSPSQLKKWMSEKTGKTITSLTKDNVKDLIKKQNDPTIIRVLEIRQEMAKASTKKYQRMYLAMHKDEKVRGLHQFCGANKTWRWAGRLFQVQNLPKNVMKSLDLARTVVKEHTPDEFELIFGNVFYTMSQLIRTALIPSEGNELLVSDFSAIEARVTAWYADEEWRLKVFRGDGKIYEASGAQMFKLPIEMIVGELRDRAKVAELALGYQGAEGAMARMDIDKKIPAKEYPAIVKAWRAANKKIVKLWYDLDAAAIQAVERPGELIKLGNKLSFIVKNNTLMINLPSGRPLCYVKPTIDTNKFDKPCVAHWGVDQETGQWCRQELYGGKILENIVQATSRDILADSMYRIDEKGFPIVIHVHDEVVADHPRTDGRAVLDEIDNIMSQEIWWAKGLPLGVKSFKTDYYLKKD